ncbi:MAG: serine/threonine-protein kinase, partial [Gemmatimonadota bacterium]
MKVCPACGSQYGDDAAFCARDRSPLKPLGSGLVGHLIGERYQIEKKLGEGGMGEVYLARHILMGRPCAIKVMVPALAQDADALGRFNREATNASRISHPNVCAVYDFGLTPDGLVYLAMEYIEGGTLTHELGGGPIPLERATAIVDQCAAGLQAAHDLGIVHRDLKPDNIMLVRQKGREVVKLVDFGIAKAGEGDGGLRVTKTGLVVGTPEYMSPEQLAGDDVDGASDQYGLALVLFRMLTGALPFRATTAQEMMIKRLTERPQTLADAAPGVVFPAGLQAVLSRAMERQPRDRFPTVMAFTEEVGSAAATMPGLPRTKVAERAGSGLAGRFLLGAGAALVLGLGGYGAWRALGPKPPAPPAEVVPLSTAPPAPIPPPPPPTPVSTADSQSHTKPTKPVPPPAPPPSPQPPPPPPPV